MGGGLPGLEVQLVQAPGVPRVCGVGAGGCEGRDDGGGRWRRRLMGESVDVIAEDSDPPSNLSAAGQEDIMVRVRASGADGGDVASVSGCG